jgi:hypothetical protein
MKTKHKTKESGNRVKHVQSSPHGGHHASMPDNELNIDKSPHHHKIAPAGTKRYTAIDNMNDARNHTPDMLMKAAGVQVQ